MAAPGMFGYSETDVSDVHRTVGPVAASLGLIALSGATRGIRWMNLVSATVLLLAPLWVGAPDAAGIVGLVIGLMLVQPLLSAGWSGISAE